MCWVVLDAEVPYLQSEHVGGPRLRLANRYVVVGFFPMVSGTDVVVRAKAVQRTTRTGVTAPENMSSILIHLRMNRQRSVGNGRPS